MHELFSDTNIELLEKINAFLVDHENTVEECTCHEEFNDCWFRLTEVDQQREVLLRLIDHLILLISELTD